MPGFDVTRLGDRDLLPGVPDPMGDVAADPRPGWADSPCVKAAHVAGMRAMIDATVTPPDSLAGEGIVTVGGGKYWPMVVLACKMARKVTDLPIQVWHDARAEPVHPPDVAGLGVTIRDVNGVTPRPRRTGGWENKTTALLNCGFRRAAFLDADAYLVGDPRSLLDAAAEGRFAFWRDFADHKPSVKWGWYGVDGSREPGPVQGGQFGIDVHAFWRELTIAHWLNMHSDYAFPTHDAAKDHQYGDQDSWRIALAATGGTFRDLGPAPWVHPAFVCRHGPTAVVHRCQGKAFIGSPPAWNHALPGEREAAALWSDYLTPKGTPAEVFGAIYARGLWGAKDSSGDGSSDRESAPYLRALAALAELGGWRTAADLGCGDGRVTRALAPLFDSVSAVDCHAPHVERLRREAPGIAWAVADIDADRESLPAADVCLVRDVLHHLPNALIRDFLSWAKASGKWRWLVLCHDRANAHPGDIPLGGYRALSPDLPPLAGLGLLTACEYLHKGVYLLDCRA